REAWVEGEQAKARPDMLYAVTATTRAALRGEEVEPNDNPTDAGTLDDGVAHGMMSRHDDVDVFRLPMLEGLNTVKVELTGVPRTDLVLSLLDRNGERLARADEHGLAAGERLSIAIN